jgi:N-acetyl-gamma-glutamyl-phosphate reductase
MTMPRAKRSTLAQGSKVRIIDASTAHRVAPGWTYGFAEIVGREAVARTRVANPGCYPTGFIALVAPVRAACCLPTSLYGQRRVGLFGRRQGLIERFEVDTRHRLPRLWSGHGAQACARNDALCRSGA